MDELVTVNQQVFLHKTLRRQSTFFIDAFDVRPETQGVDVWCGLKDLTHFARIKLLVGDEHLQVSEDS